MKITTYNEFIEKYNKTWSEEKRAEFAKQFAYTAVVEGNYPEQDYLTRWAWQQFGPMQCEECCESYSEYPACPLVQATEYTYNYTYKDIDGTMKEDSEKQYKKPEKHGHEGVWTTVWLGKTGYDYGFMEFYFKNEADRDAFLKAEFSLGERYES